MTDALKAAREVLPSPDVTVHNNLVIRTLEYVAAEDGIRMQKRIAVLEDSLRTALAEVDRLVEDNQKDKMKALLYRAYNSPEPEARQAAFRDAMARADLAEAEIDRLTAERERLQDAYTGAREDMLIWKKRALEAEETIRRLWEQHNQENGPVHMGEPVLPEPKP